MSADPRSLSVIVPAYCEAGNIRGTIENIAGAFAGLPIDHEILVIDDGSTDGTAAVVEAARIDFPAVRLLINERNMGFGWTYRRGVQTASRRFIVMVHGDNAWGSATLRDLFERVGEADIVVGYTRDMWRSRTLARTVISKTFTTVVNVMTGHRLKYYNGLQIHRSDVLKALDIESTGFGFQAEVLVKALRVARSYVEVPMVLRERESGDSKAFRLKNIIDVLATLRRIWMLGGQVPDAVRKVEG